MNILTDPLPTTIQVDGKEISIKTDFRVWIRFISLVQEYDLDNITVGDYIDLTERISKLLFIHQPELSDELFLAIVTFFSGFSTGKKGDHDRKKTFDYEIDADAIYASFAQVYGIRLDQAQMHWYEFRALFANLPEESPIGKLIHIRSTEEADVSADKRTEFRKLKESVALPVFRSYDEDDKILNKLRNALR